MIRWLICSVMSLAFVRVDAAHLNVQVLDRAGQPVKGVVIAVHGPSAPARKEAPAVMDQVQRRFVPLVLPVRVGTQVTFPNSDSVAHQVYSFSPPKRFELGLYRGRAHPPLTFDAPGLVVLGCNIHDQMIGYVYVTDADEFGKTDDQGRWQTDALLAGEHRLEVWSPLFARDEPSMARLLSIGESNADIVLRLTRPLRPQPSPRPERALRDY